MTALAYELVEVAGFPVIFAAMLIRLLFAFGALVFLVPAIGAQSYTAGGICLFFAAIVIVLTRVIHLLKAARASVAMQRYGRAQF